MPHHQQLPTQDYIDLTCMEMVPHLTDQMHWTVEKNYTRSDVPYYSKMNSYTLTIINSVHWWYSSQMDCWLIAAHCREKYMLSQLHVPNSPETVEPEYVVKMLHFSQLLKGHLHLRWILFNSLYQQWIQWISYSMKLHKVICHGNWQMSFSWLPLKYFDSPTGGPKPNWAVMPSNQWANYLWECINEIHIPEVSRSNPVTLKYCIKIKKKKNVLLYKHLFHNGVFCSPCYIQIPYSNVMSSLQYVMKNSLLACRCAIIYM